MIAFDIPARVLVDFQTMMRGLMNAAKTAKTFTLTYFLISSFVLAKESNRQIPYIVKIYKVESDISPQGISVHDCAVVRPNGTLHLEVRKQQLPNSEATLSVYEQPLTKTQLEVLHSIIADEQIQKLPSHRQPQKPFTVPYFRGFEAIIQRDEHRQRVGYFALRPEDENASTSSSIPQDLRNEWNESEKALVPLVNWLDGIKSLNVTPAKKASQLCVSDPFNAQAK